MLCFDRLQLDGNLFACGHIGPEINISEGTRPNLSTKSVLLADAQLHFGVD